MTFENFAPDFLRLDERGDVVVVSITRSHLHDEENVEQLGREILAIVDQYDRHRIVLDLTGVEYMTSSVIGKIIALHRRMHRAETGRLVLCNLGEGITTILETSRLLQYFNVESDVETALATFGDGT